MLRCSVDFLKVHQVVFGMMALSLLACGTLHSETSPWPAAPAPVTGQGGPLEPQEQEAKSTPQAVVMPLQRDLQDTNAWNIIPRNTLRFEWPLPATGVNSLYGWRLDPVDHHERQHEGLDLEAEYGDVVVASAPGWVLEAGWHSGHGRRVVIGHVNGYESIYSHLSQVLAIVGTQVKAGEALGRVGNSGRSTGPHLHFELRQYGSSLDPLEYLGVTIKLDE